ncbi:MAG: hypothetical protein ABI986_12865, partial [Chloroflexota bacterium]
AWWQPPSNTAARLWICRIEMVIKTFRRHLLPIILTPILLTCGWLVVSSPILFVYILDDAFKTSEFLMFIFYVIGIGLAISVFLVIPLTWIVERVFSEAKFITVLIARVMLLASVFIFVEYLFDSRSLLASYPWIGALLVFLFTMATYLLIFTVSNVQKPQFKT